MPTYIHIRAYMSTKKYIERDIDIINAYIHIYCICLCIIIYAYNILIYEYIQP